jgi:hypothetical protein
VLEKGGAIDKIKKLKDILTDVRYKNICNLDCVKLLWQS